MSPKHPPPFCHRKGLVHRDTFPYTSQVNLTDPACSPVTTPGKDPPNPHFWLIIISWTLCPHWFKQNKMGVYQIWLSVSPPTRFLSFELSQCTVLNACQVQTGLKIKHLVPACSPHPSSSHPPRHVLPALFAASLQRDLSAQPAKLPQFSVWTSPSAVTPLSPWCYTSPPLSQEFFQVQCLLPYVQICFFLTNHTKCAVKPWWN